MAGITVAARRLRPNHTLSNLPVLDFLVPRLLSATSARRQLATIARTSNTISSDDTSAAVSATQATSTSQSESTKRTRPLSASQRAFLDRALRVNQAGELAATLIYTAQMPPLSRSHPHLRPLLAHMHDQEAGHFATFNKLVAKHRIRPTALYPAWKVAATVLGWSTAMMGRETAMACTEAVETEIGDHYNSQVRELLVMVREIEARGEVVGEEVRSLIDRIRQIRDEELEHLDTAVENDAQKAEGHELLTGVIRGGCRAAIWVSERV